MVVIAAFQGFTVLVSAALILCLLLIGTEGSHCQINGVSTRKHRIPRTLRSWAIRQKLKPKSRAKKCAKNVYSTDSLFTFMQPTSDRVAAWFGPQNSEGELLQCVQPKEFNHGYVGMTNPFLHLAGKSEEAMFLAAESDDMRLAIPASWKEPEVSDLSNSWWPSSSFLPSRKKEWRILTYRQRVGKGRQCYERVRDAAMDWEFHSSDGAMGMVEIPPVSNLQKIYEKTNRRPNVIQRGSYSVRRDPLDDMEKPLAFHRGIGSFRRMVTFSSSKLPFRKRVYAVNPVMVIYDLVDQRSTGTTFTSTAYATMKGHLIRGEERVTIALRDRGEDVDVEIVSISKPGNSLKGKFVWPFVGSMQQSFFKQQMGALQKVADSVSFGDRDGQS